jgi:hypothetical protein
MHFKDFEFKKGINMTMRRGVSLFPTETGNDASIILTGPDNRETKAMIYKVKVKRFEDVTAEDLRHHHLGIESWADMFREMKRHYPCFDRLEIVTLVYFRLV